MIDRIQPIVPHQTNNTKTTTNIPGNRDAGKAIVHVDKWAAPWRGKGDMENDGYFRWFRESDQDSEGAYSADIDECWVIVCLLGIFFSLMRIALVLASHPSPAQCSFQHPSQSHEDFSLCSCWSHSSLYLRWNPVYLFHLISPGLQFFLDN